MLVGLVEIDDQKESAADRERANEKGPDHRQVRRREKTEADEKNGEPEHEDHQVRERDGTLFALASLKACSRQIGTDLECQVLNRALCVGTRRKIAYRVVHGTSVRP